jgi:hypothetical protein
MCTAGPHRLSAFGESRCGALWIRIRSKELWPRRELALESGFTVEMLTLSSVWNPSTVSKSENRGHATKEQQQALIDQDVSRTLRELETQANAVVVQELLNSEEKQRKKSKTKQSKRSKAKNPTEEDRAPVPSETLEDVIMAIKIHSNSAQGSSLDDDNG